MPKSNKSALRIGKLPDLTPVKLTVSLEPEVHKMLEDYARIYSDSYGEAVKPSELVPSMIAGFGACLRSRFPLAEPEGSLAYVFEY